MAKAPDMNKKCRFCGAEGFHWKQAGKYGEWKLVDVDGNIHECDNALKHRYSKGRRTYEVMRDFQIRTNEIRAVDSLFRYARQCRKKQEEDEFASYEAKENK